MNYDVAVVGAGPAGTVTARFAAELGAKVIIVERRQEIGVPVLCGEGVSRKIDDWNMLEGKRWIASSMDGARIYSPDGTMVKLSADMAGNETGYVIYRDIFDQELGRQAAKAGAKIMMNTTATGLLKNNGKIKGIKVPFDSTKDLKVSWFVYVIQIDASASNGIGRDKFMEELKKRGVACSDYFNPIHLMEFYKEKYGFKPGDLPVCEQVAKSTIALPFYTGMSEDDIQYVCDKVEEVQAYLSGR